MPAFSHSVGQRRHTGRHLVLMREGAREASARALHRIAGLRVSMSADHDGGASQWRGSLCVGEGILFQGLAAVLVLADPDQCAALQAQTGHGLIAIEPERVVSANQLAQDTAVPREVKDSWGLEETRVTESPFSGRGVCLAVLDSGIDLQHPDFASRSIVSQSFVSGEPVDDANGHGTYCAGIACGPVAPSQPPRYGVASDAELYIGKVIADDGNGADGNILAGIDWAVRNGCAIVSLSVGTPVAPGEPYSAVYEQAAHRALAAGTVILAAAGNDSVRPDCIAPVDHPANCPSIIAVAAIDEALRVAPFSCGGINADGGEVNLAAPGVAIRSAWRGPELYRMKSGTSMATPFAAGIAALLAEANPSIRGRDLKDLLTKTTRPLTLPARDVGGGLAQAP